MFLTLESQTNVFLLSCLGGFAVGLGYDVLQCLRAAIGRGRVLTAVFDGLFWLWFASSFFLFCVTVAKGEMRGYLFIGLGLGFLLYRLTLCRPVRRLLGLLFGSARRVLTALAGVLRRGKKRLSQKKTNKCEKRAFHLRRNRLK